MIILVVVVVVVVVAVTAAVVVVAVVVVVVAAAGGAAAAVVVVVAGGGGSGGGAAVVVVAATAPPPFLSANFPVRATVSLGCGGTSRENCTYFSSSNGGGSQPGGGGCTAKVCPCGANVCQLRLDFDTFTIAGPSTASASVAKALFGVVVFTASLGVSVSQVSITFSEMLFSPNIYAIAFEVLTVPDRHLLRVQPWQQRAASNLRHKHRAAQ